MGRLLLRGLLLGVTFGALFGCQGVQPTPGTPVTLDSSAEASPAATSENGEELDVRLEAVDESRPEASLQTRNPFRFGQPSSAVPMVLEPAAPSLPTAAPVGGNPAASPLQPRIQLRMIGLIEASESAGRIAVLTDGTTVFHGRAGDIVEGQYRLLGIEPTSVEFESIVDSRRQVIRLSSR